MRTIGLTGSIGMGKTTTAGLFEKHGVAVFDADAAVHDLYAGEAVPLIVGAFPDAVVDGRVDRQRLAAHLAKMPDDFATLEAIIHPMVRARQEAFLENSAKSGAEFALLDIPLLFETGREKDVDIVVVVTAESAIQLERVMARAGMTEQKFHSIVARQIPDHEKREKADFIVDTSFGIEKAADQVANILGELRTNLS
ncbi:MAG: dephospho-CoA kinase [Pseudomonadota bacterium]